MIVEVGTRRRRNPNAYLIHDMRRTRRTGSPGVHQRYPHLDYLPLNEPMLANLQDIWNAAIVNSLPVVNLEVVVVVDAACCQSQMTSSMLLWNRERRPYLHK